MTSFMAASIRPSRMGATGNTTRNATLMQIGDRLAARHS
jgi:hypothetical protein